MSRANISRGKLKSPPKDYEHGVKRLKEVQIEYDRIRRQLDDPARTAAFKTMAEYDAWRAKAQGAQRMYRCEQRELTDWLKLNEPTLFQQAYELLCDLELENDFSPERTALMEKLEEHFTPATEPVMQMKDKLL